MGGLCLLKDARSSPPHEKCVYQENCDHNGNKVVSFYSNALWRVKRVMHKAEAGRTSKAQPSGNGAFACIVGTQEWRTHTLLQSGNLHLKQLKIAGLLHSLSTLPRQNTPCFFAAYPSTK